SAWLRVLRDADRTDLRHDHGHAHPPDPAQQAGPYPVRCRPGLSGTERLRAHWYHVVQRDAHLRGVEERTGMERTAGPVPGAASLLHRHEQETARRGKAEAPGAGQGLAVDP